MFVHYFVISSSLGSENKNRLYQIPLIITIASETVPIFLLVIEHFSVDSKRNLTPISQNSLENTCAGVSFLIKLQVAGLQLRDSYADVFLWILCNFQDIFLQNTSRPLPFYTTIQQNFVLMILVLALWTSLEYKTCKLKLEWRNLKIKLAEILAVLCNNL